MIILKNIEPILCLDNRVDVIVKRLIIESRWKKLHAFMDLWIAEEPNNVYFIILKTVFYYMQKRMKAAHRRMFICPDDIDMLAGTYYPPVAAVFVLGLVLYSYEKDYIGAITIFKEIITKKIRSNKLSMPNITTQLVHILVIESHLCIAKAYKEMGKKTDAQFYLETYCNLKKKYPLFDTIIDEDIMEFRANLEEQNHSDSKVIDMPSATIE